MGFKLLVISGSVVFCLLFNKFCPNILGVRCYCLNFVTLQKVRPSPVKTNPNIHLNPNPCYMDNKIPQEWNDILLKDVTFIDLMKHRIYNVLIVANPYDAFMLEDDGRIDEKIYNEYVELGLRYPPTFRQVSTIEEAEEVMQSVSVDLVICMPGNADNDAFAVAHAVKERFPLVPCVVLTPFSHGITHRMQNEDLSIFDYVFCWLGNTNLILSIIKLIEDKMNVDHDIEEAGVQTILLVEDSIRFLFVYPAQSLQLYLDSEQTYIHRSTQPPCCCIANEGPTQGGARPNLRRGFGLLRKIPQQYTGCYQ